MIKMKDYGFKKNSLASFLFLFLNGDVTSEREQKRLFDLSDNL